MSAHAKIPWTALRLLLGLALLTWVLRNDAVRESFGAFRDALWIVPALAGLTFLGAAIESSRLGLLFRAQGMELPFREGYRVVAIGCFFNHCIPGGTGGDLVKLYYLARGNRGRGVEVATLLLVDRAVALFALLVLILGLAAPNVALLDEDPLLASFATMALGGVIALWVAWAFARSRRLRASKFYRLCCEKLPLGGLLERIGAALYEFRGRTPALLGAALLSLVGHIALVLMFTLTARLVMPNVDATTVGFLAMLGMLANALPVTPGGLGVGEAAFTGLFRKLGETAGATLILAWRVGQVPLALIGWGLYVAGKKQRGSVPMRRPLQREGEEG